MLKELPWYFQSWQNTVCMPCMCIQGVTASLEFIVVIIIITIIIIIGITAPIEPRPSSEASGSCPYSLQHHWSSQQLIFFQIFSSINFQSLNTVSPEE
jgi:hypothetical protein